MLACGETLSAPRRSVQTDAASRCLLRPQALAEGGWGGQHPGQPNSLRELRSLTTALVGFWRLAVHSFSRLREKVRDEGAALPLASGLHLGGVRRSLPQEWELKPPAIVNDICSSTKLSRSNPF